MASEAAKLIVTVDLPTPPLAEDIAIIESTPFIFFACEDIFGRSGESISFPSSLSTFGDSTLVFTLIFAFSYISSWIIFIISTSSFFLACKAGFDTTISMST